jgi:hypothetical protein
VIYVAGPFVLLASVVAVGSIVAIIRGWVPSRVRPSVERPRLYGLGTLLCAVAVGSMAVGGLVFVRTDPMRGLARGVSIGVLLLGLKVLRSCRRPGSADLPDLNKS